MPSASSQSNLLATLSWRLIFRRWTQQKLKTIGLLSVVALGVSVFLAIGLTNRASVNSFRSFTELVAGKSQISVRSSLGSLKIEDAATARQSLLESEASLFPTLEVLVALAETDPSSPSPLYKVIGVDLLAAASHFSKIDGKRNQSPDTAAEEKSIFDHLSEENAFFATDSLAEERQWKPGQTVSFYMGQSLLELQFAGSIPNQTDEADDSIPGLVMDLFSLASIAQRQNEVDSIEIVLPANANDPGTVSETLALLNEANPGHWVVESQAARQQSGAIMTLALRTNLRALSALSLIVALFLVFQALDSSVSRRKSENAALRSIGVSPNSIRWLWIIESACIGAVGGALGILLGLVTARFSASMVDETINVLYYFTSDSKLSYEPSEIITAWFVSIFACVLAGWYPARSAALTPPAQMLKQGQHHTRYKRRSYLTAFLASLLFAGLAYICPPIPASNGHSIPVGGYLLALALTACAIFIACPLLEFLPKLFNGLSRTSSSLRVGLSRFRKPVARHRLALGSVIVAVGMTAAMIVLIGSFQKTVTEWMSNVIQADIYIRSRSAVSADSKNVITQEIWKSLLGRPEVAEGGTISRFNTRIQERETSLIGYDIDYLVSQPHISWIGASPDLSRMADAPNAIINESFKERFDVRIGSQIEVATPGGIQHLAIIGVQSDFGNERGSIGVDQDLLAKWMGHNRMQGVALHLKEGVPLNEVVDNLRQEFPALEIYSNRLLRSQALQVFKQTFAITYALEFIGLFISVAGLGAMLFSSLLERRGEVGALRRIGMSRKSLSGAATAEGLGIAGLGTAFGILLGLAQGWVLIFIVNKQSFGWTLSVSIPWWQVTLLALAILATGALVSWRVGWWNSGLRIEQEE
ncbi:MAG: FtsX-like permease family protein [Verrucomicrobiota bacterium]